MVTTKKLELIELQIAEANAGAPSDFQAWWNRTDVVIRQIFGQDSPTYRKLDDVSYSPSIYFSGQDISGYRPAGVRQVLSILEAAKLEIELTDWPATGIVTAADVVSGASKRVFIVHGHNEANKHELAGFLRALTGDEPVILHQQANRGQVLIEKFELNAATAAYAVVILSADDEGRSGGSDAALLRRARQNVVFEMGFFFGALGRQNVAVLYEAGVELPSDVDGLIYILLDKAGAWKTAVARELDAAGHDVDLSALLA